MDFGWRVIPESPGERSIRRLRRALFSAVPLLGNWRRSRALLELESVKETAEALPLLLDLATSQRPELTVPGRRLLASLTHPASTDAWCELAIQAPTSPQAALAREFGKRPSDPERACLFLFVTRQLDAYFEEDFQFQNLRLQYERASAPLRAQVLAVLRSGDRRCLEFFGSRKRLASCSDREIMLALGSFRKHRDYPHLFRALLELPLKYGLPIVGELAGSQWEPDNPQQRALLHRAIEARHGHDYPPPRGDAELGIKLQRLLEDGADIRFENLSEEELVEVITTASPIEGVAAVGALSRRPSLSLRAAATIETSPHWLIRLAGRSRGIFADLLRDEVVDENLWVRESAPRVPVLEFWQLRGTPEHLEALAAAPPSAWAGSLGAARRVLQLVLAHRVTTGHFDAMVVEGEVFAGSFEDFDEEAEDWKLPPEDSTPGGLP